MLFPPQTLEYLAVLPGSIVALGALLVVVLDTFHRPGTKRDYLAYISAVCLGLGAFSAYMLWDNSLLMPTFHGMLYLDQFTLFFTALICVAAALAVLQAPGFLQRHGMDRGEFYMLVLFSVTGMIFMAGAVDLLMVFIALELLSIPVYCLAGFMRRDPRGAEAAMKYFILGAFSAGLFLYGIALIYGATGTTNLEVVGRHLSLLLNSPESLAASKPVATVGVLLVLSGFAFKIASVPFHIWTPDVYTGSPTPLVGFMASAVKAAAFAGMIRVFAIGFYDEWLVGGFFGYGWIDVFVFLSAASMILGNVVAITQSNVKRMLAYSSIAHAGYILVGFVAGSSHPEFFLFHDSVLFYLATYAFGTVGAFGVLAYLSKRNQAVEDYKDLAGLGFRYPLIGVVMGIFMFSSAGIPPTAGFVGKLYVFRAAVSVGASRDEMAFIGLAILAVLTSVAGVYYYLKVLVYMYMSEPSEGVSAPEQPGARFSLVICAVFTLYLGVFPARGLELAQHAIVDMKGVPAEVQVIQAAGRNQLQTVSEQLIEDAEDLPEEDAP